MKALLLAACLLAAPLPAAESRSWKTSDGSKTIEAEFVSAQDGKVTIRRNSHRKTFTIALDTLWVFHGAKDDVVKPENSQRMVDALKKARGEVKYTDRRRPWHLRPGLWGQGDARVAVWPA